MRKKKNIIIPILGVFIILGIINLLASAFFYRLDFTADKRFTLNKGTKHILHEIDEPIIVTLYISEDLPPDVNQVVKNFKSLLIEYDNCSRQKIEFEIINPQKSEELEQEAIDVGILPVPLEVRKKDELKVQKVYLGASIQIGHRSAVIPLIKPGISMEYTISSLIKKLTITRKPDIGYVQGHGEPPLAALPQAVKELSLFYNLKSFNLATETDLKKYKSIVIVAPVEPFLQYELERLDEYLAEGGNLFIALERVRGFLQQGVGVGVNTGLEKWLEKKGLLVDGSFIVDKKCGDITVHQQQGFYTYDQQVSFPYLPIIFHFSNHAITNGIETVALRFASPINYVGDSTVHYFPLAWTSKASGKFLAPVYFEIGKQWKPHDFIYPNLTVAALLEGPLMSENLSKLCLVGDGDFIVNGLEPNAIPIQQDNINFMVNAIDWLSDDSGLLSLRTKGVSSRPLAEINDRWVFLLKYFNFLFPVVLVILFGLLRFERRKRIRGRQMRIRFIK